MNFTGEHGGIIATAFIGAWATATAFWFGVGGIIWKLFFNPRLKALEEQLQAERRDCERQLNDCRDRIKQLETLLLLHGPQQLRQAMQAVVSEQNVTMDKMRGA